MIGPLDSHANGTGYHPVPAPPRVGGMAAAIELIGITKRFPGVVANDSVNLVVEEGEIHAICGENGAGKSTLMKILYGMIQPDEGVMRVEGQEVRFASPLDAIAAGIGMVHQHFMLADQLTVLENVILGAEPTRSGGRIDLTRLSRSSCVAEAYGLVVDPDDLVEESRSGATAGRDHQGALPGAWILSRRATACGAHEVEELFATCGAQGGGSTLLFIDHKLDEVLAIATRSPCSATARPWPREAGGGHATTSPS